MKKLWFYFLSGILAFSFMLSDFSAAVAQEKETKAFTLEEIVVTAERRESNAQDTPVSLTAFSAMDLDDMSINGNVDLQTRLPSTTFTFNKIYIRGVGREGNQVFQDPGVAVYWDGMYINEQYPIDDTFGAERIEAMRGPQDTLYGKSTVGGAINVVTKKPTEEFSGQLKARIGLHEWRYFQALVSGPLYKDKLMGSFITGHQYYGGHLKNVWDNEYAGAGRNYDVNVRLLFEPTDRLEIYGKWRYTESYYTNGEGRNPDPWKTSGVLWTSPSTTAPNTQYGRDPNQVNPGIDDPWHFYRTPGNFKRNTDSNGMSGALFVTFELTDSWTIKWNNEANSWDWRGLYDSGADPTFLIAVEDPMWVHGWQEELQFSYANPNSRISFIGGLYYYNMVENQGWWYPAHTGKALSLYGTPVDASFANYLSTWPPGSPPATYTLPTGEVVPYPYDYTPYLKNGYPVTWFYDVTGETTTQAVYGQLDYQLTEKLNLTLGLRAVKDAKKGYEYVVSTWEPAVYDWVNYPPPDYNWRPATPEGWDFNPYRFGMLQHWPTKLYHKQDWLEYIGKVGADYKLAEQTLLFGKISKGYKAGGFPLGTLQVEPFEPEFVWAYEVGWKQLWLSDRFNTNLAAYYYDYTDMQVNQSEINPVTGTAWTKCVNADGAKNWGIELEAKGYVIENLMVDFMYSYMNTEYLEFRAIDSSYPEKGIQDLEGNELNRAPKNKFAISGTYTIPTNMGDFVLYVNYYWQDETYYRPFNLEIDKAKAWDKTDARIMYFTPDHKWRVALDFSNIFNQPGVQDLGIGGQAGTGYDYVYRTWTTIAPFQMSMEVSYSW